MGLLEDKIAELGTAFADFKKINDERLKTLEAKGTNPADREEKLDKANDKISALEAEIKSLQTAMQRSNRNGQGEGDVDEKQAQYKKAFNQFMKKGNDTEVKAMSVDSDADGGYLVPDEMSSEIVTKVFESSPMRQLASAQTISTDTLDLIEDLDEVESGWAHETEARVETGTPKLNMIKIPVHELWAFPMQTQKFLDDASVNAEAWLGGKVSDKFIRDEATAFISGNGIKKPMGILSYAAGTGFGQIEQVNSGDANLITADGLIDLVGALKEFYLTGAQFLMQRATVKAVRKLKDSNGLYLWGPGLNGAASATLLGYPVNQAADMPAVAAGKLPIAFGNFKVGYQIVDRIGIRVLRDALTKKPYVGFYTTKRVGGAVKNFEAIKLQKISV